MPKGLTRKRDERLASVLNAATKLFAEKGYQETTVADILEIVGMGKGTFYHYFDSKEDVLKAVVERLTAEVVKRAAAAVNTPNLSAHEKMIRFVAVINVTQTPEGAVLDELHRSVNAELHRKSLAATVRQVAPLMAKIVEQGIAEGVYSTPRPQESVEFLLVGISAIFDEGFFVYSPEEFSSRAAEAVRIAELILGAVPGSFAFLIGSEGE